MNKFNTIIVLLILSSIIFPIDAQQGFNNSTEKDFEQAFIRLENWGGSPIEIRFKEGSAVSESNFFGQYRNYFKLSNDYQFVQIRKFSDLLDQTHYRYNLQYKGVEVIGAQFILHEKNGLIHYANGHLIHGLEVDILPLINEQTALQAAITHIGAQSFMWEDEANDKFLQELKEDPNATFYPSGELKLTVGQKKLASENIKLVYRFNIYAQQPSGNFYVDVDAISGEIINKIDLNRSDDVIGQGLTLYNGPVEITTDSVVVDTFRLREISRGGGIQTLNMQNNPNINAFDQAVDFIDADNNFIEPYDQAGVSVHWALEGTYDYYLAKHGRDSYDDAGGLILAYVHTGDEWFNAQWMTSLMAMRFGDGTGNSLSLVSIDVVGHEYTHGVDVSSANLIYQAESGALSESFADVFATSIEFYLEGPNGDWIIGEDFFPVRSMENPNAFGDPDTYFGNNWASLTGGDFGGVHTNSGVQNFWYFLLSEGGSGINDNGDEYNVVGIGLDDAADIAYRNLTTYLISSSVYNDARGYSVISAIDLFGSGSQQYQSVLDAWDAVGVYYPMLDQAIDVSSDSLFFLSEVNIGGDIVNLDIINVGLQPLVVNDIQVTGTHFTISSAPSLPLTLTNYSDAFTVSLTFNATEIDATNEILTISSDDPVNPIYSVALRGSGYSIYPALDKVMYASSGPRNDGNILSLNTATGEGTNIGPSSYNGILGLAINPSNNELLGVRSTPSESEILRVNSLGGDSYLLYTLDLGNMVAISFDNTGTLYGALETGEIYSIDLTDGSYQYVSTAQIELTAITFDPMTNDLWATIKGGFGVPKDQIFKIELGI